MTDEQMEILIRTEVERRLASTVSAVTYALKQVRAASDDVLRFWLAANSAMSTMRSRMNIQSDKLRQTFRILDSDPTHWPTNVDVDGVPVFHKPPPSPPRGGAVEPPPSPAEMPTSSEKPPTAAGTDRDG